MTDTEGKTNTRKPTQLPDDSSLSSGKKPSREDLPKSAN